MTGKNIESQRMQDQAVNCVNMAEWEGRTRAGKSLLLYLKFKS